MLQIIETSVVLFLFIITLFIVFLWLLIKSAVKSGTKEAIMECYKQILEIESNPTSKEKFSKSLKQLQEEQLQEELNNW
uniref:hypothetical protein n=1 Tax=Acetatifactor sp. TaxID=1872090 RepID=UPI004055B818